MGSWNSCLIASDFFDVQARQVAGGECVGGGGICGVGSSS